ncbi:hypothetical protein BDD12DRAFT_886440 [Trichophaea hybrida]|nr:hypothetical protein BDD12DRAFT_886440 [Trichophaea hybrida]
MKEHIERVEKEIKEKPTTVQMEQWKEAVASLCARQEELNNRRKEQAKVSKELQDRPQIEDTEEQVQQLTTTIVDLQTTSAETTQRLQEALNSTAVGQPTFQREGRSVINNPFQFDGTKPEEFEPWGNSVREKIKGDRPAYFTNTETVWEYLCGRTSAKVLEYMRARNMAAYLPGRNQMLYEGAEVEYVLEGFLKEVEENFADPVQKIEWVNQLQKCRQENETFREYYPGMSLHAARLGLSTEITEFWYKLETNTASY